MNTRKAPLILLTLALLAAAPAGDAPLYTNDFANTAPGKLPDDQFLVLAGEFEVKDVDGGRVLELAGAPLGSFGMLFGPTPEAAVGSVGARVWGAASGRRFPEFGVGSNDAGGYKLWLMPRRKQVAIRKGDETVATGAYQAWQSGTWTRFRLEVAKGDGGGGAFAVRGKVWADGAAEPKEWTVRFDEKDDPPVGRASVWGHAYSGQPIRFDDLSVER